MDLSDCKHEYVEGGECERCGLCVHGSSNATTVDLSAGDGYTVAVGSKNPPFASDLHTIDIPEDVRATALELASNSDKIHRMGARKQLLFTFIYQAYLQLGIEVRPDELAAKIGIDTADLSSALRIVCGTSATTISTTKHTASAVTAPVVVVSPVAYIDTFCVKYGVSTYKGAIIEFLKSILDKDKMFHLMGQKPNHIALAIISYYLTKNKIPTPKSFGSGIISNNILQAKIREIMEIESC